MSDTQRSSKLEALKQSSFSGMISLDIPTFQEVAEEAPRSYHLVFMISADASICKPCVPVRKQLDKLSKEYQRLPQRKKSSKPVFFAELKVTAQNQQFLAQYGIRQVPILYALRAGTTRSFPKDLGAETPDSYSFQHAGGGLNQLKEFINARTGSRFAIVRGGYQIPFVQTVKMYMPLIVIIVGLSIAVAIASEAYRSPMFWFALVMLVYIFSVGGGHYSWIHNTPLAVVNKEGAYEYIASGSRSQYVAEGFFVSATCVTISVLVILIQELPSVIPNKSAQNLVGSAMVMMTILAITSLLIMYHFVSFFVLVTEFSSPDKIPLQGICPLPVLTLLFRTYIWFFGYSQKMPQYLQYSEM